MATKKIFWTPDENMALTANGPLPGTYQNYFKAVIFPKPEYTGWIVRANKIDAEFDALPEAVSHVLTLYEEKYDSDEKAALAHQEMLQKKMERKEAMTLELQNFIETLSE